MLKKTIALNSIFTKLFKVSEEILDKNIDNFILHNLKEENNFKKNYKIFYSYLNFTKEYFICYYENINNTLNIIDLISLQLKNKGFENKKVLVYFEDYLLLFNHLNFYYFQKIEKELLSQDINEYTKKRFMFDFNDIYHVNNSDIKESYKVKRVKTSLNYLKGRSDLKIYYSYLLILLLIGSSAIAYDYYNKRLIEREKVFKLGSKIKQNIKNRQDSLYYKTSLLLNEIEENNLKIKKFNFSKKSVNMTIIINNSTEVYQLLEKYKNIKVLSYKKIKDDYEICSEVIF